MDGRDPLLGQCNDRGVNNSWHCFGLGMAGSHDRAGCNPFRPIALDCILYKNRWVHVHMWSLLGTILRMSKNFIKDLYDGIKR